ncbi:hypothetical protein BH09SUM1_BH09SUM1_30660 [soil metagenome]
MRNKTVTAALVAAAFLAGAFAMPVIAEKVAHGGADHGWRGAPAHGQHGPGGPLLDPRGMPNPEAALAPFWEKADLAAELKLSDSQIASLKESRDLTMTELDKTPGSVRTKADALRQELQKDNPDLTSIDKLLDDVTTDANAKAHLILAHIVTVKTILTPDQEAVLKAHVKEKIGELPGKVDELRGEIREVIEKGGNMEDVKAMLTEKGIPELRQQLILKMVQHRLDEISNK